MWPLRRLRVLLPLLLLALAPGAALRLLPPAPPGAPHVTATLAEIAAAPPGAFDGRIVVVRGVARPTLTTPLWSTWLLADDTGTLLVVAPFAAPPPGTRVELDATVTTLLAIDTWVHLGTVLVPLAPPTPAAAPLDGRSS